MKILSDDVKIDDITQTCPACEDCSVSGNCIADFHAGKQAILSQCKEIDIDKIWSLYLYEHCGDREGWVHGANFGAPKFSEFLRKQG